MASVLSVGSATPRFWNPTARACGIEETSTAISAKRQRISLVIRWPRLSDLWLSTCAQAPDEIVSFWIQRALAAHVVEAAIVEQIQFVQRGNVSRFIENPADELTKV